MLVYELHYPYTPTNYTVITISCLRYGALLLYGDIIFNIFHQLVMCSYSTIMASELDQHNYKL